MTGSVFFRLSFLSGHSSFSFYCATYLIVYLQARLSNFPLSADNQALTTIYRMLKVRLGAKFGFSSFLQVFRPFLQFGMISLAFWISLTRYLVWRLLLSLFSVISFSFSRISDYYHHPYDVVTGALVGITFASSTLLVMADVFNKRSAFWKSLEPAPLPEQSGANNRELNIPYIDEPEPNSQVNIFSSLPYKSTFSGHSENECGFLTEDGQFTCPSISTTLKLIPQNIYAAKNMI